jgi:hypothetical protein
MSALVIKVSVSRQWKARSYYYGETTAQVTRCDGTELSNGLTHFSTKQ